MDGETERREWQQGWCVCVLFMVLVFFFRFLVAIGFMYGIMITCKYLVDFYGTYRSFCHTWILWGYV